MTDNIFSVTPGPLLPFPKIEVLEPPLTTATWNQTWRRHQSWFRNVVKQRVDFCCFATMHWTRTQQIPKWFGNVPRHRKFPIGCNGATNICPQIPPFVDQTDQCCLIPGAIRPTIQNESISDQPFCHNALDWQTHTETKPTDGWREYSMTHKLLLLYRVRRGPISKHSLYWQPDETFYTSVC